MEEGKDRLRDALLVNYSIKATINLLEEEPSMKLKLREVMNEMGWEEREGCKRRLQWSLLTLVQGSSRLQEMFAEIKGKYCDLEVYERIWCELVAEANKDMDADMEVFESVDSPDEPPKFEAIVPCEEFVKSVAWWKQAEDEVDLIYTTDEAEEFWVHQEGDWGDETIPMRRQRYRRIKAKPTPSRRQNSTERCRPY